MSRMVSRSLISRYFQPLIGRPCWNVHYHEQLNLSLNFGTPTLEIREPYATDSTNARVRARAARRNVTVRGEWWLWIYLADWRLTNERHRPVHSAASVNKIEEAILELDGQALIGLEVDPKCGTTLFEFDLGSRLECTPHQDETRSELWMLYRPTGYVLSVYGDGTCTHERGDIAVK